MNRAARRLRLVYRRLFLRAAERLTPAFAVEHPYGVVVVPSDDATIRPQLFLDGTRGDVAVLERAVGVLADRGRAVAGSTFVDVGANLGTSTVSALLGHGFARAVAIEPDPTNVRFLRATLALNGLDERVTVVQAAASNEPGTLRFVPGRRTDAGRSTGAGTVHEVALEANAQAVSGATLDQLVDTGSIDPADVGLLWLDVQGFEGHVLAGASRLLDARVPVVLAVRRRQLKRTGGRRFLREIAKERFTEVLELRPGSPEAEWRPVPLPTSEIDRVLNATRTTDVLLLP